MNLLVSFCSICQSAVLRHNHYFILRIELQFNFIIISNSLERKTLKPLFFALKFTKSLLKIVTSIKRRLTNVNEALIPSHRNTHTSYPLERLHSGELIGTHGPGQSPFAFKRAKPSWQ